MKTTKLKFTAWLLAALMILPVALQSQTYAKDEFAKDEIAESEELFEMSLENLMEIEITSSARRPQSVSRASRAVYVITSEDIKQAGPTRIEDLFRMVPGMDVFQTENLVSYIGSRGYSKWNNERMQILLDGRPLYDPYLGGTLMYLNPVFLENIERIEIIRGAAGVAWGVNAMNGVINIITKRTADTQGGYVSGSIGNNEMRNGLFRYGSTSGPFSWRATFGNFSNEGFASKEGVYKDNYNAFQGTFRGEYELNESETVTISGGQQNASSCDRRLQYMNIIWDMVEADGSSWQVRWTESFIDRYNQSNEFPHSYDPEVSNTASVSSQEEIIEIKHNFELDNHNIVWGADYTRDLYKSFKTNDELNTIPDAFSNDQVSAYIEDEITLQDNLWFTIGYRAAYNELTEFDWAGNLALVWEFQPKHFLRGSVSRSFRRPTMWQEFRAGYTKEIAWSPLTSTVPGEGNDSLMNETMISYEVGYRGQLSDNFSVNIEGYLNQDKNMMAKKSLYYETLYPWGLAYPKEVWYDKWFNTYDVTTYGLENSFEWQVSDWWMMRGFYTYLYQTHQGELSSWDTGDTGTIQSPKHRMGLTNRFKLDESTTLNTQLYWTDMTTPSIRDIKGKPFWRFDIRLARQLCNGDGEIAIGAMNLFDKDHYEGGWDWTSNTYNEVPRQYYVQFSYRF